MKFVVTMEKEAVMDAARKISATSALFNEVKQQYKAEEQIIKDRHLDIRDLADLTLFLRYEHKFDGTGGGELSDEEFARTVGEVYKAFAEDDREKIFDYLDRWTRFAENYQPVENVNTVDESIRTRLVHRAQQSLAVTKLREYPEYVRSRYQGLDGLMKLQSMEIKVMLHSMSDTYPLNDYLLTMDTNSVDVLDNGTEMDKFVREKGAEGIEATREGVGMQLALAGALLDAIDLEAISEKGEASVKKMVVPEWINNLKGTDLDPKQILDGIVNKTLSGDVSRKAGSMLSEAECGIQLIQGATQTGGGLLSKYMAGEKGNTYRLVFIDGVSVYDLMKDKNSPVEGPAIILDALANQTGVVSFVQVAEIDGRFEYKMDVVDVRNGNDKAEYVEKISNLENDQDARRVLFATQQKYLTEMLEAAKRRTQESLIERYKTEALDEQNKKLNEKRLEMGLPVEGDPKEIRRRTLPKFAFTFEKKNLNMAFFTIDQARKSYENTKTRVVNSGTLNVKNTTFDARDLMDMAVLLKLAGTLKMGDKNLDEKEFTQENEKMIKAFSEDDHDAIKIYLDKIYDFLESYTPPQKLETVEDLVRALAYSRFQQTMTVKLNENKWYFEQRYPTPADKLKFSTFEAHYFVTSTEFMGALEDMMGITMGSGYYADKLAISRTRNDKEKGEDELLDDLEEYKGEVGKKSYRDIAQKYVNFKREKSKTQQEIDSVSTLKVDLPASALALKGVAMNDPKFTDESDYLTLGLINTIYSPDYQDSYILRSYHFENSSFEDTMRLVFVDGVSIYDKITANGKKYSQYTAAKELLHALINQTGVVQFAHITKGDNGQLSVALDTIDVSQGNATDDPEYIRKLSAYYDNPVARLDAVRTNIQAACDESVRQYQADLAAAAAKERKAETDKYYQESATEEQDFFGLGDVFDTEVFDLDDNARAERDKAEQTKLFKLNRANVIRQQLGEIVSFTKCDISANELFDKFEAVFSQKRIDKKAYNALWKEIFATAMDGLKGTAATNHYKDKVPFAYATGMVERCMKGALKLYGHEEKEVDNYGAMSTEQMVNTIKIGVPTWETRHYDGFFAKMTENQIGTTIGNIEFTFSRWKNVPMEQYKNLECVRGAEKYKDEFGNLTEEGKLVATASLIEFYDRVNVLARNLVENPLFRIDVEELREEMYKFAKDLKQAAIEIGAVSEEEIDKKSGIATPIDEDIEAFVNQMNNVFEIEKGLEKERDPQVKKQQVKKVEEIINTDVKPMGMSEKEDFIEPEHSLDASEDGHPVYNDFVFDGDAMEDVDRKEFEIALDNAKAIDFRTYKNGKYSMPSRNPGSSYSLATRGELDTLQVYFGGMSVESGETEYVEKYFESEPYEYEDDEMSPNERLAYKYGVKIDRKELDDVVRDFMFDNTDKTGERVNKLVFEKQYRMLFIDLYTDILHSINKECAKNGTTITVEQMVGSEETLDTIMRNALRVVGYPSSPFHGCMSQAELKAMRNSFVEKHVPKTEEEKALRQMQANSPSFDFTSDQWKSGLGYNDFRSMIENATAQLNSGDATTEEAQMRIAQTYRAMHMYNQKRSNWSKFFNYLGKYRTEKNAIARFKAVAKEKTGLNERQFNEMAGRRDNPDFQPLKDGIDKIFTVKKDTETDLSRSSSLSSDLDRSMSSDLDDSMERISVPEADHKKTEAKKKEKEDVKAEKRQLENNASRK